MKKNKPFVMTILMFSGILVGLLILIAQPKGKEETFQFETIRPGLYLQQRRKSIGALLQACRAQFRMKQLMKKDSLNKKDSLEIQAIDQHINQLLYD